MADIALGTHAFGEADGTELNGLSLDTGGDSFTVHVGNGALESRGGQGQYAGGATRGTAYVPAPAQSNQYVQATVTATTGSRWGVVLWFDSSYSGTGLRGYTLRWFNSTTAQIYRDGSAVKSYFGLTLAVNDVFRLELDDQGSQVVLEGFLNGVSMGSTYTDASPLGAGYDRPGWTSIGGSIDNFEYGYIGTAPGGGDMTPAGSATSSSTVAVTALGALSPTGAASSRAAVDLAGSSDAVAAGSATSTGSVAMSALGAVQPAGRGSLAGQTTPSARVAIVAQSSGLLSATVQFAPPGSFAAKGSSIASGRVTATATASLQVDAAASLCATATATATASLSGASHASSHARVTARASAALLVSGAGSVTSYATVTAGVPIVITDLPGRGSLVTTWHPHLVETLRPFLEEAP